MSDAKPRLRAVEITAFESDGQEWLYFRDQDGYSPDSQVPRGFVPALALMDGTRDVQAIAYELSDRTGEHVSHQWVEKLVGELDALYLLDSPVFRAYKQALAEQFDRGSLRPAAFAGRSYASEPAVLTAALDGIRARGEALLPPPALRAYEADAVQGIVVPHIDFGRGGPEEALAYLPLVHNVESTGQPFDTLITFGIAHGGVRYPFCATPKHYQTPLGTASCDLEFLEDLQERLGPQLVAEQFAHKNEHSVEFVAVFTQYYEALKATKLLPILCGGFWGPLQKGISPLEDKEIRDFVVALREVTASHRAQGKKIGFIASVDGAHVGSPFGDDRMLTTSRRDEIRYADRAWCAAIEAGDAKALHAHFARDHNKFNVDAHPALYTVLAAFPELRGQLLAYNQAFDEQANSLVSFATLALFLPQN